MRRAMRTILACGAALALIGGCSRKDDGAGGGPTTRPAGAEKAAGKGQLNVYMWSEYIDPEIPKEFEKETGIAVRVDVYEATEEMMAKIQQAGGVSQYDVLVASDHAVSVLSKLNLLQPLDASKLPNRKNVDPKFQKPSYDPEDKYSAPYLWGTVGIMYRKDKIPSIDPSWALFFDPAQQPGPFVMMDSMRDMIGAALKFQGKSVNSRKPEDIRAAGELLLKAKKTPNMVGFEGGVGGTKQVASGNVVMAIVYNGDAVRVMAEEPKADYVVPKEGTIIWVDTMLIPAKAPNPDGAHKFINYILDAKVGAKLANYIRYATPNKAAIPEITKEDRENPSIYPPEDVMKKLEYLEDVGADTRLYDETWTAVKSR